MISIICPIYNEQKYIKGCIDSVLAQDWSSDELELLLVDGGSTDDTIFLVNEYQEEYPFIKLLHNPEKVVPYAMNIGIEAARGDVIIRIDAHAFYPTDYISTLVDGLSKYEADNVGVVCRTDVLNKTPKTLAIREVLSNPFGVGDSLFRIGINKVTEADTVPFGCYRREVFEKYGVYNPKLVRNQDIELNKRISRGGGKILLLPDSYCVYYARESYKAIMKNNFQNGKWNVLTVFYTKMFSSLSLRHFVPLIFQLSLIVPIILSVVYFPLVILSVISFSMYMLLISYVSFKITREKGYNFSHLIYTFTILHISYGYGSLVGIMKLPFLKS